MYTVLILLVVFMTISLVIALILANFQRKECFLNNTILNNIGIKKTLMNKMLCENKQLLQYLNNPKTNPLNYNPKTNKFSIKKNICK